MSKVYSSKCSSPLCKYLDNLTGDKKLTSRLMLAILLLAAEKHKATFIAPIGIGLALFVAELLGVYYTGGSLNPARSFGPSVVLRTFTGYRGSPCCFGESMLMVDWIYWVGPILGAIIAAGFYKMLVSHRYLAQTYLQIAMLTTEMAPIRDCPWTRNRRRPTSTCCQLCRSPNASR